MIIAYTAANSLEAYMIKGLLEQHEIPAYIQGEHLQSGTGELPVGGSVKINVDNENYSKAKEIIKNWEATEVISEKTEQFTTQSSEKQHQKTNYLWLISSFLIGAFLMRWYMQNPVTYDGLDLNGDKVNDIRWTYKNNIASKTESDFNFDNKIDEVSTYDKGLLQTVKTDSNFDGIFDTESQYLNERASVQKVDTNNDGEADMVIEYGAKGLDFNSTIFNPKTRLIKKVQRYEMNKLISAELDTNDDGNLDVEIKYDFSEEEISREKLSTKPPTP